MLHWTCRILHLKPRNPKCLDGFGDLVRYGFRRSRIQRSMLDLVFEILFRHWRPTALPAETITDLLEMREEVPACLLVGFGNIARRMDTDIARLSPGLL